MSLATLGVMLSLLAYLCGFPGMGITFEDIHTWRNVTTFQGLDRKLSWNAGSARFRSLTSGGEAVASDSGTFDFKMAGGFTSQSNAKLVGPRTSD